MKSARALEPLGPAAKQVDRFGLRICGIFGPYSSRNPRRTSWFASGFKIPCEPNLLAPALANFDNFFLRAPSRVVKAARFGLMLALLSPGLGAAQPRMYTLEEALTLALQQNPTLARSDAQLEQARALLGQARALLLPTVSVSGGYIRNNESAELALGDLFTALAMATGQPPPEDVPETVVLQPLDAFNASASVRIPLFSPSAWPALKAMKERETAASANLEAARASLRASIVAACWMEASAAGLVRTAEATVQRSGAHAASAERISQAGMGTSLAVLQAKTELRRREGELVQARAALDKARLALGILLGQPGPASVRMPTPEAPALESDEALVGKALQHRSEPVAARALVESARRQVQAERWAMAPSLMGGLSGMASTSPFPTGENIGWQASVSLNWTAYQGGLRTAKVRQSSAALAEAEANLAGLELQIAQQVQSATADLRVATTRLDLAKAQLALATQASQVAQRGFDAGTVGSMEVLDALERLDQAQLMNEDATARLGMAAVALKAALGAW